MGYYINVILTIISLSIATTSGLVFFKKIDKRYQPFIFYIFYRLFCELLEHYLAISIRNNIIVYNISILIETFMLLFHFWKWDALGKRRIIYLIIISILIPIWIIEMSKNNNFRNYPNHNLLAYSSALSAFFIAIIGVQHLNTLIFKIKGQLFKNAQFLITAALVISYLFHGLTFIFFNFNFKYSTDFYNSILVFGAISNIIVNLSFAYAITLIPAKRSFLTIPS